MRKGINLDSNNGMWKGTKAGLEAIHIWVLARKPKPKFCEDCGVKPPKDLANISQKYKRDINDFEWLCRKCHMIKDGRLMRFIRKKVLKKLRCEICKKWFQPRLSTSTCCSLSCNAYKANQVRWGYQIKK